MADLWGNIVDNQPAMKGDIQENKFDMGADIPANLVIGIPGKSAYQYALEAGYTGTEAEFAEALAQIGDTPIDEGAVIRIVEAYLAEHPPVIEEEDPTVPAWAKQSEKPTYTAQEVGALPASALPEAIEESLALAKASGEFDGKDGYTPVKGKDYFDGKDGNGIKNAYLNADYTLSIEFDDGTVAITPSIRGPAYTLTSQDKDTIVNAVIGELPVYNGEAVDE